MKAGSLDIEDFPALIEYLRETGHIGADDSPRLTNLAGGVSNRTVLLEWPTGECWVFKQALEQLRVRVDWHSDPRRIEREALGMRRLMAIAPEGTITQLIFLDQSHHLLAMEAVPAPHENWKTVLLSGRLEADHIRQFAGLLSAIHRGGHQKQKQYAREFEDRSYFESLRLEPYYLYSAQRIPAVAPFLLDLVEQTRNARYTLVHGDYSPKNILIRENRLILLDHEVIHFGDGAFDLGFALTHLLSKANALKPLRADFANAAKAFWKEYSGGISDAAGPGDLEARTCRHTLACLLARCVGRSPLEYLSPDAAAAQANAATFMMDDPPAKMTDLIDVFIKRLEATDQVQ